MGDSSCKGLENLHPHTPPLENAFWPEMGGGGGGGVYNFSLEKLWSAMVGFRKAH